MGEYQDTTGPSGSGTSARPRRIVDEVMEATDALDVGILQKGAMIVPAGSWIHRINGSAWGGHPDVTATDSARCLGNKKSDGTPLVLSDVANVVEDTWPLIGDGDQRRPRPPASRRKISMGQHSTGDARSEEALDELRPGAGFGWTHDFRPADFIQLALDNLTRALFLGCLLVMVVFAAFLFEWRTALISLVAIPLSLVAGVIVLYLRGATINTMILAGFVIAIGVVVDDAIIDVENIVRRLRQYRKEGSPSSTASIILEASLEVRQAIIHATLIDAVVLLPIFFMGGVSRAFFQPLAVSYGLAVLASMGVALTVTPALCLILLSNAKIERREQPLVRWLQRVYAAVLAPIVRRPRPVFIATGLIMLVSAGCCHCSESRFSPIQERTS